MKLFINSSQGCIVIASNYVQLWLTSSLRSLSRRWMPTTFIDNLHKFNLGAISPRFHLHANFASRNSGQAERKAKRCQVRRTIKKNMGSRKGGEKWYGNGLFALGISYNPPILPLPCCFSVPQFIIFPLSLCSSFVSSPLFLCSTTYPTPFSLRSRRGEGGIVAKVRYRCRRGDTGVARITVTAAPGGWKRSPSHPFRCFERHATSRTVDPLLSGFHRTRAKVSKIGGLRGCLRG